MSSYEFGRFGRLGIFMANWNATVTVNSVLWEQVQEHIDNHYNSGSIDWERASQDAHKQLDKHFGKEEVAKAISLYKDEAPDSVSGLKP